MNTETFHLELITPCFCGGAETERRAEIRAPSIRGQIRWWFRTMGGFKSLDARGMPVRDQEAMIFGSMAGGYRVCRKAGRADEFGCGKEVDRIHAASHSGHE